MDDTFLILLALVAVAIVAGAVYRKQRAKRIRAERAAYIQKYTFPAELRNRLQRNHDLSLEGSGRVLEGLRQYFLACLAAQRSPLSKEVGMPSKAVDAAWHEFIVLTKEYASFCEKAFGRYLHHTPGAMMATPSNEALANTLHQLRGQALSPTGWAMVGTVPLIFAIDRELGFKDGHVYDESAIHTLESQRQSMIASAGSSGGDSGYAGSWGGGSDSGGGGGDGGGGSCGGGGGCGGGGS